MESFHLPHALLRQLAEQYGTPLYVYNASLIRKRYQQLCQILPWPSLKVHYAMKANYNPAILRLLKEQGACIDAVSPGDVLLARKLGFEACDILYTSNNITEQEMHEVKAQGVLFNIDSLSRLEKFGQAFAGESVCLRFNSDVVAGSHAKIKTGGDLTKFGILLSDIDQVLAITRQYQLKVVGVHKHTGSGIEKTEQFLQAMHNLLSIVTPQNFPELRFCDFGGGFKVPYEPGEARIEYAEFGKKIIATFTDFCQKFGRELALYFEPGKYLVAESGYLLIEANTVKNNNGRLIVGTNSGFPQLIRPMFYEAYHHIENISHSQGQAKEYDICGNICETGDCFAVARSLPHIREGDLLSIQNAGAYCYTMGGHYNLRAMPAEVLVDQQEGNWCSQLVRKRVSTQQLIDSLLEECS